MKMLHKLLLTILLGGLWATAQAQIPNHDFENWNTKITDVPNGWNVIGNVTKIKGFASTSAARLETDTPTGAPGAIVYGIPTGNYIKGGIPYNQKPDSVIGYFRYDIPAGDEAWLLVMFKKAGFPISLDTIRIKGSQTSGFKRMAFKVNFYLPVNPDSLVIGLTNTNPNKVKAGGFMEVDSLRFNTSLAIPNGNFEGWVATPKYDPAGWFPGVSNIPTLPPVVQRSTDSYTGVYSLMVRNVVTATDTVPGFVSTGNLINLGGPHFPIVAKHKTLNGFYKYTPRNGDSAVIFSSIFQNGKMVATGTINLGKDTAFMPFTITYNYFFPIKGMPDSANIFVSAASFSQTSGKFQPMGNSVLLVDNLSFDTLLFTGVGQIAKPVDNVKCYPNPFRDELTISYNLETPGLVSFSIYDLAGREVMPGQSVMQSAGINQLKINTSGLPAGTYLYRIQRGNEVSESKLIRFR